jgi:hypothetical protein
MAHDRFLHMLRFLHFADNSQIPEQDEYDQMWKLKTVFDILILAYAKFYNPSENLAVDEVTKIQRQDYFQAVYSKETNILV